ncbi:glutamate-cysteine ligase [Sporolactobacillus inulinus]|uniref:Glutamate-cysteine ligase n=1 Tax=Sporolactobacillus inulinus TaxID=2078 RepID=A0A4Y1Z6T8_9BACL|nr:glutamate-cysteine ligase [Sporolactobacillus inulinus]
MNYSFPDDLMGDASQRGFSMCRSLLRHSVTAFFSSTSWRQAPKRSMGSVTNRLG